MKNVPSQKSERTNSTLWRALCGFLIQQDHLVLLRKTVFGCGMYTSERMESRVSCRGDEEMSLPPAAL